MRTYTADEVDEMIGRALAREREQRKPLTVMEKEIIWKKHKRTLGGWDHGGTEVIDDNAFDDVVRAVEAAHGIKGDA